MKVFTTSDTVGTQDQMGLYQFTVLSSDVHYLKTTLSTVATAAMNNTIVECNDGLPVDTVTIRIAGCGLFLAIDFKILLIIFSLYRRTLSTSRAQKQDMGTSNQLLNH